MPMPAARAAGNERNLAMSAATSARSSVLGPRVVRLPADALNPPMSTMAIVASRPAADQTQVDTTLGLMPAMRARSGLDAVAVTVRPSRVRLITHPRARATTG